MIQTLYEPFKKWCETGSIYIVSDTHFDDIDRDVMGYSVTEEKQIEIIKKKVKKHDTLIHLGDVGNPEYMSEISAHKVLIMGNHDETATKFKKYFDEIFKGPLMISEKILLSHEPVSTDWCLNIHGHDHSGAMRPDKYHVNLAANVAGYKVFNLGEEIKRGILSDIRSLHRVFIDEAINDKKTR